MNSKNSEIPFKLAKNKIKVSKNLVKKIQKIGVLQSLRIEGSHLSEFPEYWGAPICTNSKMNEAHVCPNFEQLC